MVTIFPSKFTNAQTAIVAANKKSVRTEVFVESKKIIKASIQRDFDAIKNIRWK